MRETATGMMISPLLQWCQVSLPFFLIVHWDCCLIINNTIHIAMIYRPPYDDDLLFIIRVGDSAGKPGILHIWCDSNEFIILGFHYCIIYLRLTIPASTEPSSFTSSVVFPLQYPPMRYTPDPVAQDTCPHLISLRLLLCDRVQLPFFHCTQLFWLFPAKPAHPPQAKPLFWVWWSFASNLPIGKSGRVQLIFDAARYISADLIPCPPVIRTTANKCVQSYLGIICKQFLAQDLHIGPSIYRVKEIKHFLGGDEGHPDQLCVLDKGFCIHITLFI